MKIFFEHFLLSLYQGGNVTFFFFHFIRDDRQEQKFVTKVVKAVLKMSGIPKKRNPMRTKMTMAAASKTWGALFEGVCWEFRFVWKEFRKIRNLLSENVR